MASSDPERGAVKRKAPRDELEGEPQEAGSVRKVLEEMGAESHDPAVVHQLLEFMHRHAADVFIDSREYADYCGRKNGPDIEDVKLAVQTRVNFSFMQPPSREVVLGLAKKRNDVPLPLIQPKLGVRLPAEKHCLTQPNYQFLPKPREVVKPVTNEDAGSERVVAGQVRYNQASGGARMRVNIKSETPYQPTQPKEKR